MWKYFDVSCRFCSKYRVIVWLWCRVESLLKQRTVEAQAAAEVYLFVAEFLQLVSDSHVFQVCVVLCAIATYLPCHTLLVC